MQTHLAQTLREVWRVEQQRRPRPRLGVYRAAHNLRPLVSFYFHFTSKTVWLELDPIEYVVLDRVPHGILRLSRALTGNIIS